MMTAEREIRTDFPDGTFTRTIHNDYETTFVDAGGKALRTTVDIRGNVVKTETFTGTYPSVTLYSTTVSEFDALGRCVRITDAQDNQNTVSYDVLGRKTSMQDMDMGNWSYVYDKIGRVISQTDTKGQTITMEYDSLNRMTKKTNSDGTWVKYYYDSFTGYTGTNSQGRLVKVEEGRD